MPRNLTTGVYSAPAGTFGVTGSPISSTAYNTFVSDIGAEMTNSVDPRGETPMVSNLQMGSNRIVGLATGVAPTDAVNVSQLAALQAAGMITMWGGSGASPPTGWLFCNGAAVSRTTYANLFAAISTAFGAGDGSTTFNLPNFQNRCAVGSGGSFTFAAVGGEQTHVLTVAELASHSHTLTDPGHTHTISDPGHAHGVSQSPHTHGVIDLGHVHSGGNQGASGGVALQAGSGSASFTGPAPTGISLAAANASISINGAATGVSNVAHVTGATVAANGSNTAHNNMQPYIALNFIIKT